MHTQINVPQKSETRVLPQQGDTNTFQKDKLKEGLLEHSLVKTTMIYIHAANLGTVVRSPLGV